MVGRLKRQGEREPSPAEFRAWLRERRGEPMEVYRLRVLWPDGAKVYTLTRGGLDAALRELAGLVGVDFYRAR